MPCSAAQRAKRASGETTPHTVWPWFSTISAHCSGRLPSPMIAQLNRSLSIGRVHCRLQIADCATDGGHGGPAVSVPVVFDRYLLSSYPQAALGSRFCWALGLILVVQLMQLARLGTRQLGD